MNQENRIHRRHFIIGAAGTVGGAGLIAAGGLDLPAAAQETKPLPDYVSWKNADAVIVHSDKTLGKKRGYGDASGITSNETLYLRNNLPPPPEEKVAMGDAWEVVIEGVANAGSMTVGELKRLGVETVATVLQCSGNGRALYDHKASGSPWTVDAAGCVLWSGVPLRAVVGAMGGVADGARFVTATGGEDLPEGIDPKDVIVERSVPLETVENAILAFEMNGEPLSRAHGGPVRLVVPGYYGVNNVKYVKRLAFTEAESDAKIMVSGYRVRPPEVSGAPDQPSMWEMKVKSWISHPLVDTESGKVQLYGVAFGGMNAASKVEVSIDGGESWQEAAFTGPDLGRFAWRVFVLPVELPPGTYTITSRATDSAGNVQEEVSEENHRGYDYRGWRRLAVDVTVA
jgi:DMSO/TMAO reductase YedYZ molybdopterin-dependent catalytic subunit